MTIRDGALAPGSPPLGLLSDSLRGELSAELCDLDHWFATAGTHFGQLHRGHTRSARIPQWMLEPGPLREAIYDEFAFRARTEESATRSITQMIQCAPSCDTLDFYVTQLVDEARHAYVFRWHLIELGTPRQSIEREIERIVGERRHTILAPLEAFGRELAEAGDFFGLVVLLTVIAEGALAPAAEMSERKWRLLDPAAAEVCEGANRDEVRHLAVGSAIVRDHLARNLGERPRIARLVERGMELWRTIPILESLVAREQAFQKGMEPHRDWLGGYEVVPGRPLAQTSAEERLLLQAAWSRQMREERLAWMGLGRV
jgi:hypothetical protein